MSKSFEKLVEVMHKLYQPGGCPWDREQTHESLIPYAIEETYEVVDAIEKKDMALLKEELGDLLLQVVFHAELATSAQKFTIDDVAQGITDKLIRRHPHVFGDKTVDSSAEVLKNWEEIKGEEKKDQGRGDESLLESIPRSLPGLLQALKLSKKAAKVGFDWDNPKDVLDKIEEEVKELKEAHNEKNAKHTEEEFGDLLFSLVNYARRLKIDPEAALRVSNNKFRKRFATMEKIASKQNKKLTDFDLNGLENLWQEAKKDTH